MGRSIPRACRPDTGGVTTVIGIQAATGKDGSRAASRYSPPVPSFPSHDLLIRSRHVVTPRGIEDAVVCVGQGLIRAVLPAREARALTDFLDVGEAYVLPGLVDTHVHVNEPGRTEWEGFETATRAAAAGGVTTLVDMPLNSIPATTTAAALAAKRAAAAGKCGVDVLFWGGVVPGNAGELESLAAAGVPGFKCFLVPSGVDEFPHVGERDLREAMPIVARLGLPLLVHAELPGPIDGALATTAGRDPRRYATWLASRPPEAELEAIRLVIRLCEELRCRVHIVHLSAADALPELRAARRRGLPITVETCPHYLCIAAEEIPDGATAFKCAPPIRGRENREGLWTALAAGEIDLVASDHSPAPPAIKRLDSGDFMSAWGGIASLELGLAAMWNEASRRGFTPGDLARWMCEAPARLAGLDGRRVVTTSRPGAEPGASTRKGSIAAGCDADLVVWKPDREWTVDARRLRQRHPITPYAGRRLKGEVEAVFVRGEKVFERGPGPATDQ